MVFLAISWKTIFECLLKPNDCRPRHTIVQKGVCHFLNQLQAKFGFTGSPWGQTVFPRFQDMSWAPFKVCWKSRMEVMVSKQTPLGLWAPVAPVSLRWLLSAFKSYFTSGWAWFWLKLWWEPYGSQRGGSWITSPSRFMLVKELTSCLGVLQVGLPIKPKLVRCLCSYIQVNWIFNY